MFVLRKWNYKIHKYEVFISPAETLKLYSEDMTEPCDCANCGLHMTYGDGYTSRTIHNANGLGFPVCETCYNEEWKEENANNDT